MIYTQNLIFKKSNKINYCHLVSKSDHVHDQLSIDEIKTEETPPIIPDYVHNRASSDDRDSTRTRTITPQPVFSDDEHDSGVVPETPSPPIDSAFDNGLKQQSNHMFLLNTNLPKTNSNGTHDNDVFDHTPSTIVPTDPEQNNSPKVKLSNVLHKLHILGTQ